MKYIIDWMDEKKDKFYKIAWACLQNHRDIEKRVKNRNVKRNWRRGTLR